MVAENIKNIKKRIAVACQKVGRKPEDITLSAVTKTLKAASVKEVVAAGIFDIGENYVQELREKREQVPDPRIRWHFIGHLQTNKIKYIADWIYMIHSVDSLELGEQLSKWMLKSQRELNILVEVNTSGENSKFGVSLESAHLLIKDLRKLPNLNVSGLMTMGPFLPNPEECRPSFRQLREMKENLEKEGYSLPILSMGMTNDFEVAIEEGATIIRIGTAIFGSRTISKI
ncbi:MAG: YggS family pyridoxal phosphate-dependent enzyme [Bacteroidota bacterium]|nr:YggS family pyridoxal phosphate-dependent enzyme [Bacteroidota bacterium]